MKPLTLILILLKSKNKTNNSKNNKILVRSSAITGKRWVNILISLPNKSQNTSFSLGNHLVDDFG